MTFIHPSAMDALVAKYGNAAFDHLDELPGGAPPTKSFKGNEDQPRDEHGRWTSGGDSGASDKPILVDHTPDTTTLAWRNIAHEITAQGQGNCYEAAVTLMLEADRLGLVNPVLVQASVQGQGALEGTRFWHSWIECDAQSVGGTTFRVAIDYASGNRVVMPDALYHHLGQVEDVMEFDQDQMHDKLLETGIYGLWRDDDKGYP